MQEQVTLIEKIRNQITDPEFVKRHRQDERHFTRSRKLNFALVLLIILQKSMKSLQNVLNSLYETLGSQTVTASAFSQAGRHLKHTAFIELNSSIIDTYYQKTHYKTYHGFRVIAADGSKIILPKHPSIYDEFGSIKINNGHKSMMPGDYTCGISMVFHDVLNKVVISSELAPAKAYEVDLAINALPETTSQDLLLFDRNFPSYLFLATLTQKKRQFVIRCSKSSFKVARELFQQDRVDSRIVTLTPAHDKKNKIKTLGLDMAITVRFVAIRLQTGELEVLVTSLLDEEEYPTEEFKVIYNMRWGVETLYDVLKIRLSLENFSGQTAEAVRQDFYAAVFLTGLESHLTLPTDKELADRSESNQLGQTVNNMISFNVIKSHLMEIFYLKIDIKDVLKKIFTFFLTNPTYTGRNREIQRKKTKPREALNFHKRRLKYCF